MTIIFYEMIMIPFRLSFAEDNNPFFDALDSVDIIFNIIFLIDICLNFNTGAYIKGSLTYNRKKIFINYIKLWFWLDLLSSFPYNEVINLSISTDDQTLTDTNTTDSTS